jgi:DUF4097 and DUF4098 domain-containing protein YvlB
LTGPAPVFHLIFISLLGQLAPPASAAELETRLFEAQGVTRVEISNASGDIQLRALAKDARQIRVQANKIRFERGCELLMGRHGDVLTVETRGGTWVNDRCEVSLDLTLPRSVAVQVRTGSGALRSTDLTGSIRFLTGSGDLDVRGELRELIARTGNGNLRVQGMVGSGNLETGNGEVEVSFRRPPTQGRLNIRVGNGDTEVRLPAGTLLSTEFRTGIGTQKNEFAVPDSPHGRFQLSVFTGAGNLTVRKVTL